MSLPARAFTYSLKALSVYCVLNGLRTVAFGISTTDPKPIASATTAVTDSQLRYYAAGFAACGAIGWWAADDLGGRQFPLAVLGAMVVLTGVGRVLSAQEFGFGAAWTKRAMWVELLAPVGLAAWWWAVV